MEKEKSKSPTPPLNLSASSINYKNLILEISPVNIDQLQYQDFSDRTKSRPFNFSNKSNICSNTRNFEKFNFHSLILVWFLLS
jgi:hypothetical protein